MPRLHTLRLVIRNKKKRRPLPIGALDVQRAMESSPGQCLRRVTVDGVGWEVTETLSTFKGVRSLTSFRLKGEWRSNPQDNTVSFVVDEFKQRQ